MKRFGSPLGSKSNRDQIAFSQKVILSTAGDGITTQSDNKSKNAFAKISLFLIALPLPLEKVPVVRLVFFKLLNRLPTG